MARHSAVVMPGHRPRCGWWLRREDRVVPRALPRAAAVEAHSSAGEIRADSQRSNGADVAWPRPGARPRCGLRQRWHHQGAAIRHQPEPGGVPRSHGPRPCRTHELDGRRLLQDSEGEHVVPHGGHQHHTGGCLPRRREARSGLFDRTHRRPGGAPHRTRPRRSAAPQLHSSQCVPLRDAQRTRGVRLGRFPGGSGRMPAVDALRRAACRTGAAAHRRVEQAA